MSPEPVSGILMNDFLNHGSFLLINLGIHCSRNGNTQEKEKTKNKDMRTEELDDSELHMRDPKRNPKRILLLLINI